MIVTVTPTLMDGTVVRWYLTESDAIEPGVEPAVSASRNGVRVGTFMHQVSDEVMHAANNAYFDLSHDHDADMSHLATHRRRGLLGPLEPVQPTTTA